MDEEITIPDDLGSLSADQLQELLEQVNEAGKQVAAQAREAEDADEKAELLKTLESLKEQKERLTEAVAVAEEAERKAEEELEEAASAFDDEEEEEDGEEEEEEASTEEEASAEAPAAAASASRGATFNVPRRNREVPEAGDLDREIGARFMVDGERIDSLEALQRTFQQADRVASRADSGRALVTRFSLVPQDAGRVSSSKSARENTAIMLGKKATGRDTLTAAGGFCGPAEAITDIRTCGRTDRPIGDLLSTFSARGKYRYIHQVGLDDVFTGGTQYWTEEDDIADPLVPKVCYHLECEDEVVARPIMIPACFQYGVGQAWSNPEQIAAALAKFDVALARRSEALIWQRIHEQSNQVTYTPPVGESVSNTLVRLVGELLAWSGYTGRNDVDQGYVLVVPDALVKMMIIDSAIKAWVGPTLTRAQIVERLEDLFGVRVVISPDVRALAPVPPIDPLLAAPAPAGGANEKIHCEQEILLFKPEDFAHGMDDVDVVVQTDITTARNNDRSTFLETVETTEKLGCHASFSVLLGGLRADGTQPDLVAADALYNVCPSTDPYTFPGAAV